MFAAADEAGGVGSEWLNDPSGSDYSITQLIAGCFRFFTFTQCFDRPA
jgi:hypothetical protein